MANEMYERVIVRYDYEDAERNEIMKTVWSVTPFMVDAFVGSMSGDREHEIRDWCRDEFGDEAWPIHGRPGDWQFGSATIFGWQWMGFRTQEMLDKFIDRWKDDEWIADENRRNHRKIDA